MVKRLFDFTLAIVGLIALSPLFLFLAIWIKKDSPGPVFFRQTRIGKAEKPFKILKFRTMAHDSGGLKLTVGNDNRITNCGGFLRKYKLDELPQLLNIIKGEMSFVGPRPEVPEYVAYYTKEQKERILSVRPGITDNASIQFRNESDLLADAADPQREYKENILPVKLKLYEEYVKTRTFWGDIDIILSTLKTLL